MSRGKRAPGPAATISVEAEDACNGVVRPLTAAE
jgi:hypothetical protein